MQKKRSYRVSRPIVVLVSIVVFFVVTWLNYQHSSTHNYFLANIIAIPLALMVARIIRPPKQ